MNTISTNSFSGMGASSSHYTKNYTKSKKKSKNSAFSVHRSMSETGYLMRLAQAKTPSQVAAVIALARADANAVKQVSTYSSEITKAKKIAKSIEKQGNIKSARLRKESQLEKEAKTELSAKKIKRAKKTTEKLIKKRRARKAEERIAIANSIPIEDRRRRHIDEYVGDYTIPESTTAECTTIESTTVECTTAGIADSSIVGASVDCLV